MSLAIIIVIAIASALLGYLLRLVYAKKQLHSAEAEAKKIIANAQHQIAMEKKAALLEAKEFLENQRQQLEKESRQWRQDIQNQERRLNQREENIERRANLLERKEAELAQREKHFQLRERQIGEKENFLRQKQQEQQQILEKIAQLNAQQAREILLKNLEENLTQEKAALIQKMEQEIKETAEKKAKNILSTAIQKVAAEHTAEVTVTSVSLPNDEIKGRIIGREGRNIRAFEQATGVDLIIDDTPEAITISAFDGVRREIARMAMEKLISDGRIHPARIEEVVEKTKQEMENIIKEIGEKALMDAGVTGMPPEVVKLLGKLKFRSSYGQNQLQHTLEVAWLAGALAAELGADVAFCRRAAIWHDIGKAIDHEVEGMHHQISADLAKKYNESPKMINAILAHHEGLAEPESVEAFIVAAADAISAARPGARRESVELYLKRLEKLEKLATSFVGVLNAYAISAGRELRILVEPDDVTDEEATILARDIARKVEKEIEYPGQIKITVIRETRAQDTAK